MTAIDLVQRFTLPAAYALLPARMQSPEATAMLLAIGLQESRFRVRRQLGNGPARGFWQFERGGVLGVLKHAASAPHVQPLLKALCYPPDPDGGVYGLLEHNDVLAAGVARLLLWTDGKALPRRGDAEGGWQTYYRNWRPGKPHPATWAAFYADAWARVERSA